MNIFVYVLYYLYFFAVNSFFLDYESTESRNFIFLGVAISEDVFITF